jgi:hypothetical protein
MEARPPMGFQQHLLDTSAEDVPPSVRTALRDFCEATPEAQAGYVCRVERVRDGADPERELHFAVKLARHVDRPDDARADSLAVLTRLRERDVELAKDVGLTVLADRAVPAWEAKGQRIFIRALG